MIVDCLKLSQTFRRTLVRMFEAQDLDCVFFETHMNLKRHFHMVYECVPLPKELGDMAPIFFKVTHTQIYDQTFTISTWVSTHLCSFCVFRKPSWSQMRSGPWIRKLWISHLKTSDELWVFLLVFVRLLSVRIRCFVRLLRVCAGSTRAAVLLSGLWFAGRLCSRHREREEVSTLFWQSESLILYMWYKDRKELTIFSMSSCLTKL